MFNINKPKMNRIISEVASKCSKKALAKNNSK